MPQLILVTGSSGAIGHFLCSHLVANGFPVRGFDLNPTPGLKDSRTGDLADLESVCAAAEGCSHIIHLGAYADNGPLAEVLLTPNILGPDNVLKAAVEAGVRRVVIASSVRTLSGSPRKDLWTGEDRSPTCHYGATKIWAETLGELYARKEGLSVMAARIGWFPRNLEDARHLKTEPEAWGYFLSHDDALRFFRHAIESGRPYASEFACLYAVSRAPRQPIFDLETARDRIGYEPRDTFPQGLPWTDQLG